MSKDLSLCFGPRDGLKASGPLTISIFHMQLSADSRSSLSLDNQDCCHPAQVGVGSC